MKILSISTILPLPGFTNNNDFVFEIYKHYSQLFNHDLIVLIKPVAYDYNPFHILKSETLLSRLKKDFNGEAHGFHVETVPYFSTWKIRNLHALITKTVYFFNTKSLASLFSGYKFDIIHAQFIFPDGLLAYHLSRKYKIPYVLTTHNEKFYFKHAISRKLALKIMRGAAKILPINHSNYLHYKSLGLKNIDLLPLGFDSNFIRTQKTELNKKTKILTVAALIKLKNIDKVLEVVAELVKKYDISYTIIGKGPEKENLLKLTHKLGIDSYVNFLDYIPHKIIADEMYKHDIFIMPSYFETFGRVYFEAMAMGIPVICAKNSGIFGIFKDHEEGIAVNHSSLEDIYTVLEYLIKNQEARLLIGQNGKKLVEKYTWENISNILHAEYQAIVMNAKSDLHE